MKSWILFATAFLLADPNSHLPAGTSWFQYPIPQGAASAGRTSGPQTPTSGTTTFIFDGNRMFAEIVFVKPDGTLHKSFAYVDLGSPSPVVAPSLFQELGLDQKKPLTFRIGEMPINVDASAVSSSSWLPYPLGDNRKIEAVLPAGVMQKFQVVIDYAQRTLTLAQPGTVQLQGTAVPFRVNDKTGLIAVNATINGKSYPITIDNGSAYTWLRKTVVQEWLGQHPDWQRGTGAVGASNMRMADDGTEAAGILVRIPEIKLGPLRLQEIGALAIGPSNANLDFMDWYSKKNPLPVIGWLGGNVLRGFRITLDYPNQVSYWLNQTALDSHDLDQVGLTLTSKQGEYFVAAIATQNGKPTVEGVEVGDKLLQIDGLKTSGATKGAIFSAMHGKPGEVRVLTLERNDKTFTIKASVKAF